MRQVKRMLEKGAKKLAPKVPSIPNPTKKMQQNVNKAVKRYNQEAPASVISKVVPGVPEIKSLVSKTEKAEKAIKKISQVRRVRNSQRAAKRVLNKYKAKGLTVSSKLQAIINDRSLSYTEKQADRMIARMRETEHELGIYRKDRETGKTYGRVVSLYERKPAIKGPDGKVIKYRYRKRTDDEIEQLKYKAAFSSAKKILSPGHFAEVDRLNFRNLMQMLDKYGGGIISFKEPKGEAFAKRWFASLGLKSSEFAAAVTTAKKLAPPTIALAISAFMDNLIDNPKSNKVFYADTFGRAQFKKWQTAISINPKFKDISPETFERMEKFFKSKAGRTFMKHVSAYIDSETLRKIITRNDKIDASLLLEEFQALNLDPNDPAYADKLNVAINKIIDDITANAVSVKL